MRSGNLARSRLEREGAILEPFSAFTTLQALENALQRIIRAAILRYTNRECKCLQNEPKNVLVAQELRKLRPKNYSNQVSVPVLSMCASNLCPCVGINSLQRERLSLKF